MVCSGFRGHLRGSKSCSLRLLSVRTAAATHGAPELSHSAWNCSYLLSLFFLLGRKSPGNLPLPNLNYLNFLYKCSNLFPEIDSSVPLLSPYIEILACCVSSLPVLHSVVSITLKPMSHSATRSAPCLVCSIMLSLKTFI